MVSAAVSVTPFRLAEMVTVTVLGTLDVFTVNVALDDPAGTVTVEGTLAFAGLVLESDIAMSSTAGAERDTVPTDVPPPLTTLGFTVRDARAGVGSDDPTVRIAPDPTPPTEAQILGVAGPVIHVEVVAVKVALICPAATVTVPGT
jgi:hypothetical protein